MRKNANAVVKIIWSYNIPVQMASLMGDPALWRGESREQYDELLVALAVSVKAKDVVDWAWASDIAYHIWDGRRLQRFMYRGMQTVTKGEEQGTVWPTKTTQ